DLFGTLTAALGPISRDDLEAINVSLIHNWKADYFSTLLVKVRRFVHGDAEHGYGLVHPRLRAYLRSRIKTKPYEAKLLAYCIQWAQHHSRYALGYYIYHLADLHRFTLLVQTCKDLLYLALKSYYLGSLAAEKDLLLAEQYAPKDAQL